MATGTGWWEGWADKGPTLGFSVQWRHEVMGPDAMILIF